MRSHQNVEIAGAENLFKRAHMHQAVYLRSERDKQRGF